MSSRQNVYFIVPLTEKAEDWICENIANPKYQQGGLAAEGPIIDDVIAEMQEAGLREEEDFWLRF
ncbi:MAG: hypothetical protein FJ123_00050 [Deltaproteobacteria bacterium]|nr:hypothetical protein [Deltaproteobacteria bacterium]